jgi:hypothetical protein
MSSFKPVVLKKETIYRKPDNASGKDGNNTHLASLRRNHLTFQQN